jgi:chemotaxis response regulator CheB
VFGMPKQAIKLNAAEKVVGLHEMAHEVGNYFKK